MYIVNGEISYRRWNFSGNGLDYDLFLIRVFQPRACSLQNVAWPRLHNRLVSGYEVTMQDLPPDMRALSTQGPRPLVGSSNCVCLTVCVQKSLEGVGTLVLGASHTVLLEWTFSPNLGHFFKTNLTRILMLDAFPVPEHFP